MNKIEQTRLRLIKAGRKIFNLSSGNPNEFGIFFDGAILASAYKVFLKTPAYEPDPKGDIKARKAVRNFYADRGLNVGPEQIVLTSGSSESYFYLFKMLAKPGEKILFPRPSYPLFEEIARLAEVEIEFYNLDEASGWQVDCENLESRIRPDVKAIVLISPSNPTGAVLSAKTLRRVAEIAAAHNLPIISDEVFSEYIFDGRPFPRMAEVAAEAGKNSPTVFTLNGISKTYALPGLKLSWVVVTEPTVRQPLRSGQPQRSTFEVEATSGVDMNPPVCLPYMDRLERSADAFLTCNQVSQAMLPDIIKKGDKFIRTFKARLQANRDMTAKMLGTHDANASEPRVTFHVPEGGFYLFARIDGQAGSRPGISKSPLTDEDFVISLMEHTGIFAHPGYFYDYDKGIYILISLLPATKTLEQKLKKIMAFISPSTHPSIPGKWD